MGVDTKLMNRALLFTLLVCLVSIANNLVAVSREDSFVDYADYNSPAEQISLWDKVSENVYVSYPFGNNAYNTIRQYLLRADTKRITSFYVENGRAKVVFN